jgi:hypothetical protein
MKLVKYLFVLVTLFVGLIMAMPAIAAPKVNTTEQLAEDSYLYGLQQVIFYGQRWTSTQNDSKDNSAYSGTNRFSMVRKQVTPDFPVVTPNATTMYGSAFLDLQREPMVLEMPEIEDRHFSAQAMSPYGIYHTMLGNQFNGTKARKYVFLPVGYKGKVPADFASIDVIRTPSDINYLLVRIAILTGSDEDIRKINTYQDQITLTPMSEWLANGKQGTPQAETKVVKGSYKLYPRMADIAKRQVDKQTAEDFFSILNLVLNDPSMTLLEDSNKEAAMLQRLAAVDIGKGLDFQWAKLDQATRDALVAGFKSGYKNVKTSLMGNLIDMNGWMLVRNEGGFETRWLDRAIMADAGWAGPDSNVAHTGAFLFVDNAGKPLSGANHYTLTFDINDLPPVTEFWSIPVYDKEGYLVRNPINRYTVNNYMLDQLHVADEKLVIYVQKEMPSDPVQLQNWLPVPEESFRFTARFYGPGMSIVDGSYKMPKPVKIE